jgi:hypothetical protein
MRPVRFLDLDVGGTLHHVIVEWNTSFVNAYRGRTPLLWGSDEALTAANAMRQALIDDGYTPIGQTSYLWVPNASSSNYVTGPAVFLHLDELPVRNASYISAYVSNTIGFTRFAIFYDDFEQ